jgi:hypothetical protein
VNADLAWNRAESRDNPVCVSAIEARRVIKIEHTNMIITVIIPAITLYFP